MVKNRTILEFEVKGREYRLECFSESPLEDVIQALSQMNSYVMEKINASAPIPEEKKE